MVTLVILECIPLLQYITNQVAKVVPKNFCKTLQFLFRNTLAPPQAKQVHNNCNIGSRYLPDTYSYIPKA